MSMSDYNGIVLIFLASCVICAPQINHPPADIAQLACHKCDDEMYGCRNEVATTEVCQLGTRACMIEIFFVPNGTKKFNFRSGCSTRNSCPLGYTNLMCTDFINGLKTCRLCCFDSKCNNPAPASETRVKVMKDLLSKIGLDSETVEKQVERENEIAFNRGAASLTTEARPIETKYQKDESEDRLTRTTHRSPIEEAGKEAFSSTSESLTHSTDEIYEADPANLDNEYTKSKFSIHNVEEPSDPTEESEEPIVVKENKLLVSTKENVHGTSGNTNKEYLPASSKDVQEKYARPGNEPQMYDQDLGAFSEKVPFDVNFKRLGNSAIREVSKMSVLFLSIFLLLV